MICEKCGGRVNTNMKCSICGYDNSTVDYTAVTSLKLTSLRSTRITVLMSIVIVLDAILAIINLYTLFSKDLALVSIILLAFIIFLTVVEIFVCIFVLKMKKWALLTYIGLSVVGAIIQLLTLNFLAVIFKALLLYFVFRNDWEYFD